MKAVICPKVGPEGYVELRDIERVKPGDGQVVVETKSFAINFPEVLQIANLYQVQPPTPFILGMEYSGLVVETGPNCQHLRVGDRVAGMHVGAFAEYATVDAYGCWKIPDALDFETASTLCLAGGTACYGLKARGSLKKGESLAVLGASGGTGGFAVQLGKAMGARVIATGSTPAKCEYVASLGADEVIDTSQSDLGEALKVLTDGEGVDVIYDAVGGKSFESACRRIRWNGRILTVGYASGTIPKYPANLALIKGAALIGVNWARAYPAEPQLATQLLEDLFAMAVAGQINPQIGHRFGLSQIDEALDLMRTRGVTGKVVLKPGE